MHIVLLGTHKCVINVVESPLNEMDCGPGGTSFAPGRCVIQHPGKESVTILTHLRPSAAAPFQVFSIGPGGDGLGSDKIYNTIRFGAREKRDANSTAALAQLAPQDLLS